MGDGEQNLPPGGDPDKTALVFAARSVTYAELGSRAARVHGALASMGIRPPHRVAVMLPNGIEFFEVGLGAAALACDVVLRRRGAVRGIPLDIGE